MVSKEIVEEVRTEMEALAKKYPGKGKFALVRQYRVFIQHIIPKYSKKYGADDLMDAFSEIRNELKAKAEGAKDNGIEEKVV